MKYKTYWMFRLSVIGIGIPLSFIVMALLFSSESKEFISLGLTFMFGYILCWIYSYKEAKRLMKIIKNERNRCNNNNK